MSEGVVNVENKEEEEKEEDVGEELGVQKPKKEKVVEPRRK